VAEAIGITTPKGFRAAGVHCGVKPEAGRLDLALVVSDVPAAAAGTFTTNKVCGAPVKLSRQRIEAGGRVRAMVVNSGCANTCTGPEGLEDARKMGRLVAAGLGVTEDEVLVGSTGRIGRRLPMEKIEAGIVAAVKALGRGPAADDAAARAILTTDLVSKVAGETVVIGDQTGTLAGICKGSGMIEPNMATMIAILTTDLAVEQETLRYALSNAVERSFNMTTVDGHMSTSDTVVLLANGVAGGTPLTRRDTEYSVFAGALDRVCTTLAKKIARDGEGATKLIEVEVSGAAKARDAKRVAKAIANSPLIKAATYGGDANWGRVVGAAGTATAAVDEYKLRCWFGGILVFDSGRPVPADAEALKKALAGPEVAIHVDLGLGTARAVCWGCDLTEEYVRINLH
jgi:glutamate N-acetyltransferase/amino-acid N-acetyltransferase